MNDSSLRRATKGPKKAAKTGPGDTFGSRPPRQLRSKRTEERVLKAAERLLSKTKTAEFTLAEVAVEAEVSVGGLYRRFPGKESILVAVQLRIYAAMNAEYSNVERAALNSAATLESQLRVLVAGVAEVLRRHASQIKAIVEASWLYGEVAKLGVREFNLNRRRFRTMLMRHADEIRHEDPERALHFCFGLVYELIASHFGFGRRTATDHSGWNMLMDDLQRLCHAYLTAKRRVPTNNARRAGAKRT